MDERFNLHKELDDVLQNTGKFRKRSKNIIHDLNSLIVDFSNDMESQQKRELTRAARKMGLLLKVTDAQMNRKKLGSVLESVDEEVERSNALLQKCVKKEETQQPCQNW